MADERWDIIIVGQGLAGTTLAWHLHAAGKRVLLVDACEPVTSSKIAAGLITPVTGKRLVLSDGFETFMAAARAFYRGIEKRTGQTFFHDRTAIRLFKSPDERQTWSQRGHRPEYRPHLVAPQPAPLLDPQLADAGAGGFAMHGAQLDVAAYLRASRAVLPCRDMRLDWRRDVAFGPDGVSVGGLRAGLVISCEGHGAAANPHLAGLAFNAAKGDILTIRVHRPVPAVSLHRGIWLAPAAGPDLFMAGSTYDWAALDRRPDPAARARIEDALHGFLRVPYSVIDHRAAVRPILARNRVLAGLHPHRPGLGFFNGLGSKGALLAPWHGQCLADFLVHGAALPDAMTIREPLQP